MKKKTCQNRHARRRAKYRFGVTMGPKTHEYLIRVIQEGHAQLVEKQSNRISVWDCEYEGQMIRLVYDRNRKQIVTFLYPDQTEKTQIKQVAKPPKKNLAVDGTPMSDDAVQKRDRILAGLKIPKYVQDRYIDAIKSKTAKYINRQSKSVGMYEIEDDDGVFWVMYHVTHGYITNVVRLKDRVLKLV